MRIAVTGQLICVFVFAYAKSLLSHNEAQIYNINIYDKRSHVMRKYAYCICKNKDADQLCSKCAADQRLCFCYLNSTIPLVP